MADSGRHLTDGDVIAYMAKLEDHITQHGWAVQGIGAGDDIPQFAYTIGLWKRWKHPEIFIVGPLAFEDMTAVLNTVGDRVRDGEVIVTAARYDEILGDGYQPEFISIEDRSVGDWFNTAHGYYGHWDFTALQLCWPDKDNLLPWEEGYSLPPTTQPLVGRSVER